MDVYRLDLEPLLLVLRTRSGFLEASIPSVPGLKGRCQAVVTLVNGKIANCTLRDQQGNTLSGDRALRFLYNKVFEWTYQEPQNSPSVVPDTPTPEAFPPISTQWSPRSNVGYENSPAFNTGYRSHLPLSVQAIPKRVEQSPQNQSWPRLYRSVFMLVDGTRSIAGIAELLHQNEASILSIITELAQYGIIEF